MNIVQGPCVCLGKTSVSPQDLGKCISKQKKMHVDILKIAILFFKDSELDVIVISL